MKAKVALKVLDIKQLGLPNVNNKSLGDFWGIFLFS
jgi:hypothetical protein